MFRSRWPNADVLAPPMRCEKDGYIMRRKQEDRPNQGYFTTYRCPAGHEYYKDDRAKVIGDLY